MRWRLSEIPLRESGPCSQSARDLDGAGQAALKQGGIPRFGRVETAPPTDPPR
jgi:hypothetical protein